MVIEPPRVVFFCLIQVPVVAAAVKHGCKGRCLWHLSLRRHTKEIRDNSEKVQGKEFSICRDNTALESKTQCHTMGYLHTVKTVLLSSLCRLLRKGPTQAFTTACHNHQVLLLYLAVSLLNDR